MPGDRARNKGRDYIPDEPSRWERFCLYHSLSEDQILDLLKTHKGKSKEITLWIRKNANSVFIPEPILTAVGLETKWLN